MTILQPGQVLAGRYRVGAPLGHGGMSSVYLAETIPDRGPVAIKVIAERFAGEPWATRFAREARYARRLAHPGCVRVLDDGRTADGAPFLVMECLAGPTLRDQLAAMGVLEIGHAVAVTRELLAALDHAHAAGVLHRDVKPENVMYRGPFADRDVVLIDFGLSRVSDDAPLTHTGTCLGSPTYCAPERLLGRDHDARCDLYAVGVVLFELVTGRPPFVGKNAIEIGRQHIEDAPPHAAALRPDLPAPLAALIRCALEKDPAARFSRAATMAAALDDVMSLAGESGVIALELDDLLATRPPPVPRRRGEESSGSISS